LRHNCPIDAREADTDRTPGFPHQNTVLGKGAGDLALSALALDLELT
jgi:hypothetical protein